MAQHVVYEKFFNVLPPETKVLNVGGGLFGEIRNGDMIAMLNLLQHVRDAYCPDLKLYVPESEVSQSMHCKVFLRFLKDLVPERFSEEPGTRVSGVPINLWNYRGRVGDLVSLPNPREKKQKITIFPVFDAPYNDWRNWPLSLAQEIIDKYSHPDFDGYEKFFCSIAFPSDLDYKDFKHSTDLITNLHHLMESEYFIGGDTGTSHFAGALSSGPACHYYYHGEMSRLHTSPFHFTRKGDLWMYKS